MAEQFRADNIGSLLRPAELIEARGARREGWVSAEELRAIEDRSILTALALQKSAGVDVFTDGEYRRGNFMADFANSLDGIVASETIMAPIWRGPNRELASGFRRPDGETVVGAKLRKKTPGIFTEEAMFLKQHAPGPFKVCIPSVVQFADSKFKPGVTDQAYPTRRAMVQDFAGLLRDEVQGLFDGGATYVQLDGPSYLTHLMDERRREQLRGMGADPDEILDEVIAGDNALLQGLKRGADRVVGIHFCRGNNRSSWSAEGSYEIIAEKTFGSLQADRFLMEYDSDRAGGFEPLRCVPKGKTVVLGLITTKEPQLEPETVLCRRIDEAARYVPLENLAISTQCGFASTLLGNLISWDDMRRRKLELVAKVARRVWGN
jgi:5-methyltetrahydropteroyltriglutamate--homocysteine methyltransferase